MAQKIPSRDILYMRLPQPPGNQVVSQLSEFRLTTRFPALVSVIVDAYSDLFEDRMGVLPPGSVREKYNPDDRRSVAAFAQRALRHTKLGSRYAVIHDPAGKGHRLLGYIKTSPGSAVDLPLADACYVNDVIVRPGAQRGGLGMVLAHAGLKFGGYDLAAPVYLDAYDGSPHNQWYLDMGFREAGPADPVEIGGVQLPMYRYSTEAEDISLGGLVAQLEARMPELANAQAIRA